MQDQDDNIYLLSLSILSICLLDNLWTLSREVTGTCYDLWELKGLLMKLLSSADKFECSHYLFAG